MAPIPHEHTVKVVGAAGDAPPTTGDAPLAPDAVVITGMSGLLPGCLNIQEFAEKLYNKENLVKQYEPRWQLAHPELRDHFGKIPGLDRFDAQFFMVHYRLGNMLDAMARKILENSYQAIFDAGISPAELTTQRVGVYVAVGSTETEKGPLYTGNGLGLLGCCRTMTANRVSYWLNAKGPSMVMDASCCGSLAVLEKAYTDISTGVCDAAIVGASKVILHPQTLIHYQRTVRQNEDGKTKCYDVNADGQSCSEAINVFLLQKYKNSKRVYASVCYAKSQFGAMDNKNYKFDFKRDPKSYAKFLRDFYAEAGIPPSLVEYVEGFGAAVPSVDKAELQAMEEVFCKDRTQTLLIGSVMSNIGYTEAASGSSAIIKILLAYQRGELAATLHCDSPRQDIAALRDGRMRIANKHQHFRRTYAAVNGLSVTGHNGHALLGGYYKPKNISRYQSDIPYLVTVSGRIESAVQKLIDHLKSRTLDAEEIALLHNIHKYHINGHLARGYGIYSTNKNNETIAHREKVDYYDDAQRPLWFVYSGMGSQWVGMGTELMRIPVFAAAIERCRKVLEPKGVDIIRILTSPEEVIYDNILHSFVGIAAVQIGLTDVLTSIGLVPDKIIGHSVGELGCAYADGCLTAEEMILASYSRGLVSNETSLIVGSMAAVGLGYEKISAILPPEIEVACHNGPDSSTISGPVTVVREFVAQLTAKGIFSKEVPCSNIAYHSRYIAKAGPGLLEYLRQAIKTPKLRSERWVSTSVPQNRWHEDAAKYSSAEYHTNNLLNPVLFEETARLIPSNAVVVEIAPHGLLQAILKRSLPASCIHIPLTQRGHVDSTLFLLDAIGKLYMKGYNANIAALYPQVEFPVSTETPSLSHLVEWVYADHWALCLYTPEEEQYSTVYTPIITTYDDEYAYLAGHVIEGTRVFPFAASLVSVWDTLTMSMSKPRRSLPVTLSDIYLHVQPRILDSEALHLTVSLQKGSGRFEVSYEHGVIVEGYIATDPDTMIDFKLVEKDSLALTSDDVYKLLHEKGYEYKGEFRSISKTDCSFEQAELNWNNNWVTLIDGLFQLNALRRSYPAISQPTHIKSLSICPNLHIAQEPRAASNCIDVKIFELQNLTRCNGIILENIAFVDKPYIKRQSAELKTLQFYPFFLQEDAEVFTTLYVFLQIVMENLHDKILNIFDIGCCKKPSVIESIKNLLSSPPEIKHEVTRVQKTDIISLKNIDPKPDVLLAHDLLSDKQMFEVLFDCLPSNTFIVSIGVEAEELYPASMYRPVCVRGKGEKKIELALWRPIPSTSSSALTVRNSSEIDFLQAMCSRLPPQNKILILASNPTPLGLTEIIQKQKKLYNRNVNVVMFNHNLSVDQELDQLPSFDLTYNILNHGQWGGEYYVPLPNNVTTKQTVALRSTHIGKLNSLSWVEVPEVSEGVSIQVHYAALNAYDVKRARAEISTGNENDGYGLDFSGITDRGERVFGLVREGAICNRISNQPELLWPVPNHWDLEDAATVALPYLQAFYCFAIKTEIREGMRVLIHSGAGALGQAAISIALAMNCDVFTTVSNIRKKKFLKKLFPELKGNHIGNSRDSIFSDMILSRTSGQGCDIVLNNLQGELKNASLSCCAAFGTTLDVVQIHTRENFSYGMYNMTKARSYVPVDFTEIIKTTNHEDLQRLYLLVAKGISKGYVRPLSRVTYSPQEAPRAFRLLAASNHLGRVLIRIADEIPIASSAQPRLVCSPDHQQLLVSDEDVLCMHLADRLINRGAKKLRLYLPRTSGYVNVKKIVWQKRGAQVDTVFCESWRIEELMEFLQDSKGTGIVESLFFITRDLSSNDKVTAKESVIKNLDKHSRTLFPSIRNFAVISEGCHLARELCNDRAFYGLPSLSFQLQDLDQFHATAFNHASAPNHKMKLKVAVETIEKAICSKQPVVFGYVQNGSQRNILEEIAHLPGISITSSTDHRSTLEQVGLDQGRAQELSYLLEEKFNIVLPTESLPRMTINELKKLQEPFNHVIKEEHGLGPYFNEIDADEMIASAEFVLMPTLLHNQGTHPDTNNTYLCIVPGMEGYHNRFDVLCERLKMPAVVLKPNIDILHTNFSEMAQNLVNVMMQRLKKTKTFYLLGYELGIVVALEMAIILESYGLTGTVYCLGGTPEDIQSALEIDLKGIDDQKLQDNLVQHLTTVMTGRHIPELLEHLQEAKNWHDKIEACIKMCCGEVAYTSQFIRAIVNAAYNNIKLIRNHRARPYSLRSKVVILRAKLPCPFNIQSTTEFSTQPLSVHELSASLSQAPKSLLCSAIINKYVDPAVLEAFDNKNQCDLYPKSDFRMKFLSKEN